jgi:uncharacterized SAM-binding protein YcdF (DUF218 family)
MSWYIWLSHFFKALFLPPGINFLLLLLALLLLKRFRRSAISLLIFASASLFLLSLPSVSDSLQRGLETSTALTVAEIKAIASEDKPRVIVVLSGGRLSTAPEYGQIDTVNSQTLQRLQYASWLQKRTNLPILLSGGSVFNEATAEAVLMNQVMLDSFSTASKWIESKSKNTAENAQFSAQLLRQNNIEEILLVTHAWHMPRAKRAFEQQGVSVIEAAMAFQSPTNPAKRWLHYLPDEQALARSCRVIQEIVGDWWYRLRY